MSNSIRVAALVAVVLLADGAKAQEFRIYTRVMMVPVWEQDDKPQVLARSLTLFHAGKVYDYIDTAGEVLLLEPSHRRFTILNSQRELATTVEFDELSNLLKVARHGTESYIERLNSEPDAGSRRSAEELRFQLDPTFEEKWDARTKRLTLSGRYLRYRATCGDDPPPEVLETWSKYADAMCRLNFVLHPGAVFPEPRLALNAALARRGLLPTEVELQADTNAKLHLRAEHQFRFELDARDRSLMHQWESLLSAKNTRRVTFHEYQRALTTTARRR